MKFPQFLTDSIRSCFRTKKISFVPQKSSSSQTTAVSCQQAPAVGRQCAILLFMNPSPPTPSPLPHLYLAPPLPPTLFHPRRPYANLHLHFHSAYSSVHSRNTYRWVARTAACRLLLGCGARVIQRNQILSKRQLSVGIVPPAAHRCSTTRGLSRMRSGYLWLFMASFVPVLALN